MLSVTENDNINRYRKKVRRNALHRRTVITIIIAIVLLFSQIMINQHKEKPAKAQIKVKRKGVKRVLALGQK